MVLPSARSRSSFVEVFDSTRKFYSCACEFGSDTIQVRIQFRFEFNSGSDSIQVRIQIRSDSDVIRDSV